MPIDGGMWVGVEVGVRGCGVFGGGGGGGGSGGGGGGGVVGRVRVGVGVGWGCGVWVCVCVWVGGWVGVGVGGGWWGGWWGVGGHWCVAHLLSPQHWPQHVPGSGSTYAFPCENWYNGVPL